MGTLINLLFLVPTHSSEMNGSHRALLGKSLHKLQKALDDTTIDTNPGSKPKSHSNNGIRPLNQYVGGFEIQHNSIQGQPAHSVERTATRTAHNQMPRKEVCVNRITSTQAEDDAKSLIISTERKLTALFLSSPTSQPPLVKLFDSGVFATYWSCEEDLFEYYGNALNPPANATNEMMRSMIARHICEEQSQFGVATRCEIVSGDLTCVRIAYNNYKEMLKACVEQAKHCDSQMKSGNLPSPSSQSQPSSIPQAATLSQPPNVRQPSNLLQAGFRTPTLMLSQTLQVYQALAQDLQQSVTAQNVAMVQFRQQQMATQAEIAALKAANHTVYSTRMSVPDVETPNDFVP